MKKQFLNLGKALSKAEQRSVNGGVMDNIAKGDCIAGCKNKDENGDNVIITGLPDCNQATMDWACFNQGGANTCTC